MSLILDLNMKKEEKFIKKFRIQNYGCLPIISAKWKCVENVSVENFNCVQSDFYQTNKYFPNGFYKPISLLIDLNNTKNDEK